MRKRALWPMPVLVWCAGCPETSPGAGQDAGPSNVCTVVAAQGTASGTVTLDFAF